jgi:TRAP-type C4-dicarboxylate transport system substrate-binding protein
MSMNRRRVVLPLLAAPALSFVPARRAHAQALTFKIATLAPEGSSWMKVFHEFRQNLERRTSGQIKIKYFAGGVAGDERDVVRKMKLGQLHGAAVTAVGLGLISPDVRALELPFLFRSDAELDHVRTILDGELRKGFEDKGFILLSWGDVGPVRLYTNLPLKTVDDPKKVKMWAWNDDPIMRKLLAQVGFTVVPLGVPDVLPSQQTGVIDGVNGSPLAAVALQWHARQKYITSMELSQSVGAAVLTKKAWDSLPPDAQKIVTEENKTLADKLTRLVRADNATALKKMQTQGLQVIETPAALLQAFQKNGLAMYAMFDGSLYSRAFRERVQQVLAEKRKQ